MIEPVSETNLEEVLPLIEQYQAFYQVKDISCAKNRAFFSQFGDVSMKMAQAVLPDALRSAFDSVVKSKDTQLSDQIFTRLPYNVTID